jgi:hypothetical protein
MTNLLHGNESLHSGQKEKSAICDRAEYKLAMWLNIVDTVFDPCLSSYSEKLNRTP